MTRWPLTAAALAVTLLLSTACASSGRSLDAPGHEPLTRTVTVTTAQGQRTAIVLTYSEGLSNAEVADALDTTVSAVETLLVRGKQNLRRALDSVIDEDD